MSDGYTIEQMRADYATVLRFLAAEVAIRERLAEKRAWERETWLRKTGEAQAVRAAFERLGSYVAATGPEERLPTAAGQLRLL